MKRITGLLIVLLFSSTLPLTLIAEDTRGIERVGEGTKDVVTSPAQVVEGTAEGMEEQGATGVVTGTAEGAVDAAGQAAGGAVDIGTGAVESVLDPIVGE